MLHIALAKIFLRLLYKVAKLSDLEKYFILIYVGCSSSHDKMTLNQLSADELLVCIVESSTKFCKNICVGTVVIPRHIQAELQSLWC